MRCREASERLSLAADGQLAAEELRVLNEHIEGCMACQQTQQRLVSVDALLTSPRTVEPPASMTNQVMDRVRAHKRRRALVLAWSRRAMWLVIIAATAALVAIAFSSAQDLLRSESSVYASLVRSLLAVIQLGGTLARGMQVVGSALVQRMNLAILAMYAALAIAVAAVWMRLVARGPLGAARVRGN